MATKCLFLDIERVPGTPIGGYKYQKRCEYPNCGALFTAGKKSRQVYCKKHKVRNRGVEVE